MVRSFALALLAALLASCSSTPPALLDPSADAGADSTDAAVPDAGPSCRAPSASPGTTFEGNYALDGWQWQKQGRIAGFPEPAAAPDGALGPALVVDGDQLLLFFTIKTGLDLTIYRSLSSDGLSFSAPVPIEGLAGGNMMAYPSVLLRAHGFWMWFASGSFELAKSADGLNFTLAQTGVLTRGATGSFDEWGVLYPNVLETAGGLTLWYTGFDGQRYRIGRATSTDGLAWTRDPSPVLSPEAGSFDNRAVAQPCVVATASGYRAWYGGYDTSRTDPGPYRIGMAESADGIHWTKRGVSLDISASGSDAYSTRDPAVVRFGGKWLMVYSGMGTDRRYRLHVASSDVCGD